MNRDRVHHCVERLCYKGCKSVWSDIRKLEAGESLPETEALDEHERSAVISELKSVMAVYGEGNCTIPDDTETH